MALHKPATVSGVKPLDPREDCGLCYQYKSKSVNQDSSFSEAGVHNSRLADELRAAHARFCLYHCAALYDEK
jgi:hypothetical protein